MKRRLVPRSRTMTPKKKAPAPRNTIVAAMIARHGGGVKIMKDRRTPRSGAKNNQAKYLSGDY